MSSNLLRVAITVMAVVALLLAFAMPQLVSAAGWQDGRKEYGLKLLAVSDEGIGTTANLYLKVTDGKGNVFVEAGPVTKLDTRISLKLAKEIACQSLPAVSEKCNNHDFFFRVEANASLIGGPSAGAAAAALAIAAVDNDPINQSVAVTGTINSGGIIGNVGGLKDKIGAAAASGISQVLIPNGERYAMVDMNKTIDIIEYGRSVGVKVSEVKNVDDVLLHITGKNYSAKEAALEIDPNYSKVMRGLSEGLCSRSSELSVKISNSTLSDAGKNLLLRAQKGNTSATAAGNVTGGLAYVLEEARNQTSEGFKGKEKNSHYSAASMCFGANVKYSYLILLSENISVSDALLRLNLTAAEAAKFEREVPDAKTLADVQVRGTVNERIREAIDLVGLGRADFENGNYAGGVYNLAFANERLGSANAWSRFLTSSYAASSIPIASASYAGLLRDGCIMRLQDAEERMQYLDVYLPGVLKTEAELGPAYSYLRETDYLSCIYRASLATAKVNAMLSALGGTGNLTELVDEKLKAAKRSIIRQTGQGEFPIISYSYYEYAASLKQANPSSALLFSDYALELSSLDIYLKPAQEQAEPASERTGKANYILAGAAIGFFSACLIAFIAILSMRTHRRKKRIIIRAKKA